MKKLSWFVFFLILTVSCLDDPDCFQLHNDLLGATFRVIGTGQADSVMLKNSTGIFVPVPSFTYKLNYFQEQDRIALETTEGLKTLDIDYVVKNQFVSEDCGSSFVLSDLRILDHDFDSARVISATPSKTGGTNLEIYRCPETDILTLNFNQLSATISGVNITNRRSAFISHPFDSITDSEKIVFTGRAATVRLPVDLTTNETTFTFKTDVAEHTLVVGYNLVTEQRYRPCGIQTFVNDLTVTSHTFDSIAFGVNADEEPLRTLQDPHIANLRIFDCPKTNLLKVDFKSNPTTSQTVTIKSIKADHLAPDWVPDGVTLPYTSNTITLPVDLASSTSTFYIEYDDGTTDTLRVQYTTGNIPLFNACNDPIVTALQLMTAAPNIVVLATRTTLQFPAITNVEITVN